MWRAIFLLVVALAFVLLPRMSSAAVLINEIAWMGGVDSANDEWIELFNDGDSPVDVASWQLSDNTTLAIELSGVIAAGAYAVLERTDDDSAAGPAFLIYSGALGNDGRTLTLRRADGSIEDQVAGGDGWTAVGGNNVTKHTAQLTTGGWITAAPTPGRENSTVATESEAERISAGGGGGAGGGGSGGGSSGSSGASAGGTNVRQGQKDEPVRISLQNPDTELQLALHKDSEGIVTFPGHPIEFKGTATGLGPTLIDMISYEWNFGDGSTSTKHTPEHRYDFPGSYVVVATARVLRHEAIARTTVTILPYNLSVETAGDRVFIHNDAGYETNIGELVLTDGSARVSIPKHTLLVPRGSLTLGAHAFKNPQDLTLLQPNGAVVAVVPAPEQAPLFAPLISAQTAPLVPPAPHAFAPGVFEGEQLTPPASTSTNSTTSTNASTTPTNASTTPTPLEQGAQDAPTALFATPTTELVALAGASGTDPKNSKLPLFGLVGIIGLGLLATYATRIS